MLPASTGLSRTNGVRARRRSSGKKECQLEWGVFDRILRGAACEFDPERDLGRSRDLGTLIPEAEQSEIHVP